MAASPSRCRVAQPVLIDGQLGLVWSQNGAPRVVCRFAFDSDRIRGIELRADPEPSPG
ncbi:MAG: hypothetical protein ACREPI_02925 [Candidatus Dormibacterales bacterium]